MGRDNARREYIYGFKECFTSRVQQRTERREPNNLEHGQQNPTWGGQQLWIQQGHWWRKRMRPPRRESRPQQSATRHFVHLVPVQTSELEKKSTSENPAVFHKQFLDILLLIKMTMLATSYLVADCGKENKPAERQCEGIATRNCQLDIWKCACAAALVWDSATWTLNRQGLVHFAVRRKDEPVSLFNVML